jgi:hypothetical protein
VRVLAIPIDSAFLWVFLRVFITMSAKIPLGNALRALGRQSGVGVRKCHPGRYFHSSPRVEVVKPFLLADIGEGISSFSRPS